MKNEEKRYYVTEDRQGADFGKYRIYTIEQWREQAKEWCEMDDNDELWGCINKLPKDQVIDFIDDMWTITLKETTFTTELLQKAFNSYIELKELVEHTSKTFDELYKELNGYNLDFDCFDFDYKELVATIEQKDGKLQVCKMFDIWNDSTLETWVGKTINELKNYI